MKRRDLLFGVSGGLSILAGCTSGNEDTPEETPEDTPEETSDETEQAYDGFPDVETLLNKHVSALSDNSVEATEYRENTSADDSEVLYDRTIRSGGAGTLLIGPDVARNISSSGEQQVWFTDNTRVSRVTHAYYPQGVTLPIIDQITVANIVELLVFEQVEKTDDEESSVVFEANGLTESAGEDVTAQTVNGIVKIAATGYIQTMEVELEFTTGDDTDETRTVVYEYNITGVGETQVSPPEFVGNALHIKGSLTDDLSAVVLEHAGGPPVKADTRLTFQDASYIALADRNGPSFPTEFTEGDTAYVYWTSEEEPAISMDQKPSSIARKITLPSEEGGRNVYLQDEAGPGPQRFEIRFARQA